MPRSLNVADIAAGGNTAAETFGENLGFAVHIVAIVLLVLSYREFWAKVRRGALFKAAAVLVAGDVDRNPGLLGPGRDVPRNAGTPRPRCRTWPTG